MLQEICRYNQKGFCKFGSQCFKYHENEKCLDRNCTPNECIKRHPKVCRYFAQYRFCKFGGDCVFVHEKNVTTEEFELTMEDVKNLKAEVDVLKNTIKSLTSIKQEGKVLKKLIDVIKEETQHLQKENEEIAKRIKHLEDEYEDETDEDSESESETNSSIHQPFEGLFSCKYCDHEFGVRCHFDTHMMTHEENSNVGFKCSNCDFVCSKENTLQKHMNTRHQVLTDRSEAENSTTYNSENGTKVIKSKDEDDVQDVEDLFQMEMFNGETIYACNICDEGLYKVEEVRLHIIDNHRKVVKHIHDDGEGAKSETKVNREQANGGCNDTSCLRLGENKCLCYYDKDSDDDEG